MIECTSFIGIPLRTQSQRRRLVLGYYALLAIFFVPLFVLGKPILFTLIAQTLTLGGILGGIRAGGPVKPYGGGSADHDASSLLTLNLEGKRRRGMSPWLDEREQAERDHAHYLAYKILRWVLGMTAVAYLVAVQFSKAWLEPRASALLWMLLVVVLGLPQSVILWNEAPLETECETNLNTAATL